ncbi:hypothetical protein MJN76_31460, partial [Salmonella enterica subsp. enterica serovar Anatum]|nr:hypothetical protein [Salmonella enterica subsp. enterica serovar Anatum]
MAFWRSTAALTPPAMALREDFITKVRILLNKSQGADVVIFPELFTIELFTLLKKWQERPI